MGKLAGFLTELQAKLLVLRGGGLSYREAVSGLP